MRFQRWFNLHWVTALDYDVVRLLRENWIDLNPKLSVSMQGRKIRCTTYHH